MDVSGRGIMAVIHLGAVCLTLMRRSVRSWVVLGGWFGWERWGTYDACCWVDCSGEGVDCNDVLCFFVPGRVFLPVCC